jgi:hypothetical protein
MLDVSVSRIVLLFTAMLTLSLGLRAKLHKVRGRPSPIPLSIQLLAATAAPLAVAFRAIDTGQLPSAIPDALAEVIPAYGAFLGSVSMLDSKRRPIGLRVMTLVTLVADLVVLTASGIEFGWPHLLHIILLMLAVSLLAQSMERELSDLRTAILELDQKLAALKAKLATIPDGKPRGWGVLVSDWIDTLRNAGGRPLETVGLLMDTFSHLAEGRPSRGRPEYPDWPSPTEAANAIVNAIKEVLRENPELRVRQQDVLPRLDIGDVRTFRRRLRKYNLQWRELLVRALAEFNKESQLPAHRSGDHRRR